MRSHAVLLLVAAAATLACERREATPARPVLLNPRVSLDAKTLLPILRSFEANDAYATAGVYVTVSEGVGAFLAQVTRISEGSTRIDYVLTHRTDWTTMSREQAFEAAWRNLSSGLRVSDMRDGELSFFSVQHSSGFPAAAVAMPGFHQQATEWIGGPVAFAAIPDSGTLLLAPPGSPAAASLQKKVAAWDGASGPAYLESRCYLLDRTGLKPIGK
jgi:hypothetical protein